MKQKRLLMAILMMAMMMPAVAQRKQRVDPDHAKYSITGMMRYDNGVRLLEGATGNHIKFAHVDIRPAKPTDMADLEVRFDSVRTDPYHPMDSLLFWRYDEEIEEWVHDSEVRQGVVQMESTMKTNIMLVIDNSSSLGEDFKNVQDAAIAFVQQLYNASKNKDIFRVGVIGFSTVKFTRIQEIVPLDNTNYRKIISFIRNLKMQNGTALYYSMETALNMLEKDVQNNINSDVYKESRIYAFTDGLDQASVDDSRNLTTPTKYFDHLRPMMRGATRKRIMGMPRKIVPSTIVTVRGGDMTDGQERQFDQRANEICDNVRKLKDMSQLVGEFQQLAKDLVNSNKVLFCYIPVGASGRVGWTFAEDAPIEEKEDAPVEEIVVAPSPKGKFWMGIGPEFVSGWYPYYPYYYDHVDWDEYKSLGLRLDVTIPMSRWFGLGATYSVSYQNTGSSDLLHEGGIMTKFTFVNKTALLFGAGVRWVYDGSWYGYKDIYNLYATVGLKFKLPLYIFANVYSTTDFLSNLDINDAQYVGFGLGIGWSIFGGR